MIERLKKITKREEKKSRDIELETELETKKGDDLKEELEELNMLYLKKLNSFSNLMNKIA